MSKSFFYVGSGAGIYGYEPFRGHRCGRCSNPFTGGSELCPNNNEPVRHRLRSGIVWHCVKCGIYVQEMSSLIVAGHSVNCDGLFEVADEVT